MEGIAIKSKVCSIEGCGEAHYAKGLCRKHYRKTPEIRLREMEYRKSPVFKAYIKEYRKRPEAQAKRLEYFRRPGVRERHNAQMRAARTNETPEQAEKRKAIAREYYKDYNRYRDADKLVERCVEQGLSKPTAEAYVKDGALLKQRTKELDEEAKR